MSRYHERDDWTGLEIAVIGMSCRFPGAVNIEQFWENLKNGIESTTFFSDEELTAAGAGRDLPENPAYVKAKGRLEDAEAFDPAFFGYKPLEAELMDPQMRVFSESCWEALENAGYDPGNWDGTVGLYAGANNNREWEMKALLSDKSSLMGGFAMNHLTDRDFLSTRLAYKLNLTGPAVTVKTACSTGLVAVDMACRGLLTGQCDIALAGAVTVMSGNVPGYLYRDGLILSVDGHCRAFDADARGIFFSEGSGVVVLKRLVDAVEDRDTIHAVVKGSAVNNDGERKGAFEAPCVEGQAEVIRAAIHMAEVSPESITYVETHGTGTTIGDPIEFEGLKKGFNSDKKGFCSIGSVKTNFGHLDTAAGIAGFIKTVLALEHRLIPPSLHYKRPNPKIDFQDSPFYVNTALTPWESNGHPLRAGVSSFGIGGTNAHVILEEAPQPEETTSKKDWQIIALSAKTESALEKAEENLINYFKENPHVDIPDAAYTLLVGRKAFKHRKLWVVDPVSPDFSQGRAAVQKEKVRLIFMFSGQGAQYVKMGIGLYNSQRIFREEMDRCFNLLGGDLKEIVFNRSNSEELNRTEITQPVLFIFEYALAKLLMHWGLEPHAMIGHSIGEYVAACLSGVFSLEEALKVVALRGKLMQQMPTGSMLSVTLPEDRLKQLLEPHKRLSLAAVNAPSLCVVSGPHEDVDAFESRLKGEGIEHRRLHTSHAYHSAMMDPVVGEFESALAKITLNKPKIPYISNVSGTWISVEEAVSPAYWATHLRRGVRFSDGIAQLKKDPASLFVELGPGRSLTTFVKNHPGPENGSSGHIYTNLVRHPKEESPDDVYLLSKLGQLWLYGAAVDWNGFYSDEKRQRIPLPTYPFERHIYRVEGDTSKFEKDLAAPKSPLEKKPDIGQWLYTPSWKRSIVSLPGVDPGEAPLNWLFFMDDGSIGSQLSERIEQEWRQTGRQGTVTVVRPGEAFESAGGFLYLIDPGQAGHYNQLIADLKKQGKIPHRVVHLWNVGPHNGGAVETGENRFEDKGFYSLIYLAQAIGSEGLGEKIQVTVVTDNMQEVTGDENLSPRKATVLGPAMVIPMEYPNIWCRCVDIVVPPAGSNKEQVLVDQLEAELNAGSTDKVVAYRNHYRLVQDYEPLPPAPAPKEVPHLKNGGVYLITGGLGGIGLEIARHLSRRVGAGLILTGRSSFPQREEWRQWLDTHGPEDNLSVKIRKVMELEEMGSRVVIVGADVSHLAGMQKALTDAEEQLGKINGVFHAAGVPGGGMIQLKTREKADEVLLPKVNGTLVLDSLLKDHQLDFFILCSSINSVLPMFGQVDYFAANAFLDAFAFAKRRNGTFSVSINWDTWQEVGIAVEAAKQWSRKSTVKEVNHPLFDRCVHEDDGQEIYLTRFAFDRHWVLSEHKVAESGKGLAPGVTYLEMAREAFEKHRAGGEVEISDVYFFKPMMVGVDETREARFTLKKQAGNGGYDFLVRSRSGEEAAGDTVVVDNWQTHAIGKIRKKDPGEDANEVKHDIQKIAAACSKKDITVTGFRDASPEDLLVLGPRWLNIRRAQFGEKEALATIKLPETFHPELDFYKLHPALLDSAVAFYFPDLEKNAYIPFSYKRLTIKAALPSTFFSHCKLVEDRDGSSGEEFLKFDISIIDEQGLELVDIKEFTMLRVSEAVEGKIREKETSAAPERFSSDIDSTVDSREDEDKKKQKELLKNGILPPEGIEVFDRIMAGTLPQVVVSTTDLSTRIETTAAGSPLLREESAGETALPAPTQPRPKISSVYVAPKTEMERKIAEVWQGLLGIEQVGIHDDFFELGGDSLNIVQLNNELKKIFDKDIPVAVMFRYQTIHAFTLYLKLEEKGDDSMIEEEDRSEELKKSKDRLKARMKRR